jgi:hypothetical protein
MHAATPAPDGKPARPAWQGWGLTLGYLLLWVLVGLGAYTFALSAFLK